MRLTLTLFKVIIVSMLMFTLCYPVAGGTPAAPLKHKKEMYRAATGQLPAILKMIPMHEEVKYGFNSREEFKRAVLGIPYQEFSLHENMATGHWRIPVVVDSEHRALLRMKQVNGKWVFAGFGASRLARELGFHEKHFTSSKPSWGRIVRDFEMKCDYIQFNPGFISRLEGVVHPLESAARIMLRSRDTIDRKGYTVEEIKAFRMQIKRARNNAGPGQAE
jgi:hypothetical protein